jgi:hypothetical protein
MPRKEPGMSVTFESIWKRRRVFFNGGRFVYMEDGQFLSGGLPLSNPDLIESLPSPWRELAWEQAIAPREGTITYWNGTPSVSLDLTLHIDERQARMVNVSAPPEWAELLRELEPGVAVGPVKAEVRRAVKEGQPALEVRLADVEVPVLLQDEKREWAHVVLGQNRIQAEVTLRLGSGSE